MTTGRLRTMSMNFATIDFEAANSSRISACSIGLTKVIDGQIADRMTLLIKPHPESGEFSSYATEHIHGLTAEDVADAPYWPEITDSIMDFLGDLPIAAHNADYDFDVLLALSAKYGLDRPDMSYFCTHKMSRRILPKIGSHKLIALSESLGIDRSGIKDHDAGDDAYLTALITLKYAEMLNTDDIESMLRASGGQLLQLADKKGKKLD